MTLYLAKRGIVPLFLLVSLLASAKVASADTSFWVYNETDIDVSYALQPIVPETAFVYPYVSKYLPLPIKAHSQANMVTDDFPSQRGFQINLYMGDPNNLDICIVQYTTYLQSGDTHSASTLITHVNGNKSSYKCEAGISGSPYVKITHK